MSEMTYPKYYDSEINKNIIFSSKSEYNLYESVYGFDKVQIVRRDQINLIFLEKVMTFRNSLILWDIDVDIPEYMNENVRNVLLAPPDNISLREYITDKSVGKTFFDVFFLSDKINLSVNIINDRYMENRYIRHFIAMEI